MHETVCCWFVLLKLHEFVTISINFFEFIYLYVVSYAMCMLYHRLEVGCEEYVKFIVEALRIRYEATAL